MRVVWEPTGPIEGIVTDIDLTLYSGDSGKAYMKEGSDKEMKFLSGRFGLSVEATRNRISETRERMAQDAGIMVSMSLAVQELGIDFETWNTIREDLYQPERFLETNPRLVEMVRRTLQYFPIVAATNSPQVTGVQVLRAIGLNDLLDKIIVVGPEDTGYNKPQTKYFAAVMERLDGILRGRVLAIGDRIDNDLWPAVQAGAGGAVHIQRVEETISLLEGLVYQRETGNHQHLLSIPQLVAETFRPGQVKVIGLTGQAGCGKSTLSRRIARIAASKFKYPMARLGLDTFFKLSSRERREWLAEGQRIGPEEFARRRNQINWWDFEKAEQVLVDIKAGKPVKLEGVYNREDKGELTGTVEIPAAKTGQGLLLVFEGVAIAHLKRIDKLVYLHVPREMRFGRILARDIDRRPDMEAALKRFRLTEEFERPYFERYWKDPNLFIDNSALVPALQLGLNEREALELGVDPLEGLE